MRPINKGDGEEKNIGRVIFVVAIDDYTLYEDVRCFLHNISYQETNLLDCTNSCNQNPSCVAFTFSAHKCYLKSTCDTASLTAASGWITYHKTGVQSLYNHRRVPIVSQGPTFPFKTGEPYIPITDPIF